MNQQILWWEPTVIVRRLVIIRLPWIEHQVERDCFPRVNTAVKRNACANEVVLASRALVSRAKFEREVEELDVVTRNLRKWFAKGRKNGERKSRDLSKAKCGYSFYLPFSFELYQKSYPLFKHRNILACRDVYKSYETSWLWQTGSTMYDCLLIV